MKLEITGASHFVNRMFEACGNYQWARELLKNSLEAEATKVEFGIEWQAVEALGVYRRTVIDNGAGMDRDELLTFFRTLGQGAKKIGSVHDNFGVGARIATLPWNPQGLVVISYKGSKATMIWIRLDPDSGDYELVEFDDENGPTCAIDPEGVDWSQIGHPDWSHIKPDWVQDHGTIVVMLGSEEHPDTVLGNPKAGENAIKGLSVYLNTRFWDLESVEVSVAELRSDKKNNWPQSAEDKDKSRRPNNRQIRGARYHLTSVKMKEGKGGKLADCGLVLLDDERVEAEWYLWDGERPNIHPYARENGYIAVRYNGELFEVTSSKVYFRWFGVIEGKVQEKLTIILEPQHYQADGARWGVHPDQSRNRLIFTGNNEKGIAIPMSDWGFGFAESMPGPVAEAIQAARGELAGSIDDDEYRKRLQEKFGNRWTMKGLVKAKPTNRNKQSATDQEEDEETVCDLVPTRERSQRKRNKTVKIIRKKSEPGGPDEAVEREIPVSVPRYELSRANTFERPWHLAMYAPRDRSGPTVYINLDSPILQEIVEYHQAQYLDVYAEEVANTVRRVFGEVAACKVAHSQRLTRLQISDDELNLEYRTEKGLTIALMGLMAEETIIAQRLGKFGRKKDKAAAQAAGASPEGE